MSIRSSTAEIPMGYSGRNINIESKCTYQYIIMRMVGRRSFTA